MRQFLLYAVIRLGLWVLIWWLLTLLDVGLMLAGVLAAFLAMLISILFLDKLRGAAAMRWKDANERRAQRREEETDEDAEFEDSLLDSPEGPQVEGEDAAPEDPLGESLEGEDDPAGPGRLPELDGADPDGADPDGSGPAGADPDGADPAGADPDGPGPGGPENVRGSDR